MKAASTGLLILGLLAILGVIFYFAQIYKPPAAVVTPVEYEGEIKSIGLPEEVKGTYLTGAIGTEMSLTSNGEEVTLTPRNRLGGIGSVYTLAFAFEINGAFKEMEFEITNLNLNAIELLRAYILPDEEGVTMDVANALYKFEVDSERQRAELEVPGLSDAQYDRYVVVIEAKVIGDVAASSDLFKVVLDGSSEGDITDAIVYIINAP